MKVSYFTQAAAALILLLSMLPPAGCTSQPSTAEQEAAVISLLDRESQLAIAGDLEGLLALYVPDAKNARLSVTKSVSAMITGWEAVRRHQENLLESSWMDWQEKQCRKENVWVKVSGGQAWAVCDNVWQWVEDGQRKQFQNIQITICEKAGGSWRIAFQAFIRDPEHMDIVDIP